MVMHWYYNYYWQNHNINTCFIIYVLEAEQSEEQLYQEISKVGLMQLFILSIEGNLFLCAPMLTLLLFPYRQMLSA